MKSLILGVDAGKVTTSLALAEIDAQGAPVVLETRAERHFGDPLGPFVRFYRELDHRRLAAVAATGAHGDRLAPPALAGVPEEIAQERAAAWLCPGGALNVVRVGGGGYSVLARDAAGRVVYEANERCSAGTGETVEALCGRLGRTLDEAVELAEATPDGVVVTSRCAVFAKSELTHFANQGEPHGRIFRGLFEGVARNVHSVYDRAKVEGPVLLVGHGALIGPVVDGFAALAAAPATVSPEAGVFEALGVALYAAGEPATWRPGSFPVDPDELVRPVARRVRRLAPAAHGPGSVVRLDGAGMPAAGPGAPPAAAPAAGEAAPAPAAVLGLDLGSTGSKAVLVTEPGGAVLASVYRRTEGNPVEAAQALVAEVLERADAAVVVAVGLTGSGRDAAATVFRAAYPDLGARLTVQNEIVAHATAAAHLDPDGGRSLSIVEIGGQDAKFINVENGRVVDADMNRVCSAGTGSFLEEQALAHGVDDIAEFGRLAAQSEGPPDLGTTCTVFVADVAAEALGDGFSREDVFAGLHYSVVRNYRSRVMGQRRLLDRVFFQGKPASDPALARALAAVMEREVLVPPDPGAMGALGIAMLAAAALGGDRGRGGDGGTAGDGQSAGARTAEAPAIDLTRVLGARVTGRREFQCKDASCRNLCRLELAEVQVDGSREKVVSGGQCPKYDDASAGSEKLPKDAPSPFRQRRELLERILAETRRPGGPDEAAAAGRSTASAPVCSAAGAVAASASGAAAAASASGAAAADASAPVAGVAGASAPVRSRVGLPYAHYLIDTLPFFHAYLTRLGYGVAVLRPGPETLAVGDRRCAAAGACAPVKLLHGLVGDDLDVLFAPVFVHLPLPNAGAMTYTCPMAQGAPDMVARALAAEGSADPRAAPRDLREGGRRLRRAALPPDPDGRGARPGGRHRHGPAERGGSGRRPCRGPGRTAQVRGRSAAHRRRGYRVGPRARRSGRGGRRRDPRRPRRRAGRRRPRARRRGRRRGRAGGLLSRAGGHPGSAARALGVGRSGAARRGRGRRVRRRLSAASRRLRLRSELYAQHLFADLLEDWPHAVLESDGHGGKAGYVTRVQAFLHAVRAARAGGVVARDVVERLSRYDEPLPHSLDGGRYDRYYFGHIGGGLGKHLAAAMRGAGMDASYVGEADPAALACGAAACSGKECLPYVLIWGTLARFLEERRRASPPAALEAAPHPAPATSARPARPAPARPATPSAPSSSAPAAAFRPAAPTCSRWRSASRWSASVSAIASRSPTSASSPATCA